MIGSPEAEVGVYVHWPYCARICPYCDFNVVRERGRVAEKTALVDAIVTDMVTQAHLTGPRRLTSIFFGGGTPSLMTPGSIAYIVDVARRLWTPTADLEISLEANPTDAESARFMDIAAAGVHRLSLGVQSLDDRDLTFLGRNHDARGARDAINLAQKAFPRVSIDLIYALPGQSAEEWRHRLNSAIETDCEHISAYQLSVEPGAAFSRAVRRGAIEPISDDLAADLYETTRETLSRAGYEAYEVSNHARGAVARSRHNMIYWRGGDYVGVGPGAHGRLTLDGNRISTVATQRVADYIASVSKTGSGATFEPMTCRDAAVERLFMGLRTVEGVAGGELRHLAIPMDRFDQLADFVTMRDNRLVAKLAARLVLDRVVAELVADSARD